MHKRKLCYITCLLTVALAACTSTTPTSIVEITGQSDGAPVGCSPRDVGERLEDLFKALNQNDLEQAMSFFGTGDRLEWYSAPEADSQIGTAYNLKDLSAYFSR